MLDKELADMGDFNIDDLMEDKQKKPSNKRQSLGRGLGALLGDDMDFSMSSEQAIAENLANEVSLNLLYPTPFQPRKDFDKEALESLANSIKEKGVLQPLLVRKQGDKYEIIAGERRFRASKLAGLSVVPVIVKNFTDKEVAEVALVENLIRENLSAIEEAEGLKRLMDDFSHTQENLAKIVGKSRSYVANTVRLLSLPDDIKEMVRENKLSAGHARNLIGLENATSLANQIISKDLSVRQVEALVTKQKNPKKEKSKENKILDTDVKEIEKDLVENLGLRINITPSKAGGGKVVLQYASVAELDMIIDILTRKDKPAVQTNAVVKNEASISEDKFSIKLVD